MFAAAVQPAPSGGSSLFGLVLVVVRGVVRIAAWYFTHFGWVGLLPLLVLWAIGAARPNKALSRMSPREMRGAFGAGAGNILVGVFLLLGLGGWLHKNRKDVGQFILAGLVAVAVAVLLVVVSVSPAGWRPVVVAVLGGMVVWAVSPAGFWRAGSKGGPIWRAVGDRPLAEWAADRARTAAWQRATSVVIEGATVGTPVSVAPGVTVAPVTLPAGATVEQLPPEAFGSALNAQAPDVARAVEVIARPELGRADIVVREQPQPAVVDPWDTLRRLNNRRPWAASQAAQGDPINFGWTVSPTGQTAPFLLPNDDRHLLIAGATGEGKSKAMQVILSELASRADEQFVILDPTKVEYRAWEPRCLFYASGTAEVHAGWNWLIQHMSERASWLAGRGEIQWRTGVHGPRVNVIVEEFGAHMNARSLTLPFPLDRDGDPLPAATVAADNNARHTTLIKESRKFGFRLLTTIQRPSHDSMATDARAEYGRRIAFALEDSDGNAMVFGRGDKTNPVPDATQIAVKGGCWVRLERRVFVPVMAALLTPQQSPPAGDVGLDTAAAVREIAAATAGLRAARLHY